MPIKRRIAKRRVDPAAEAAKWETLFDSGWDFFGDLTDIGVPVDAYGRPDRATSEEAWHRLGHIFLANRTPDPRQPWALEQFGEPHAYQTSHL